MSNSPSNQSTPVNSYIIVKLPPEKFTPEWALYHFLNPFTPEDMEIAIKKEFPWELTGYVDTIINYASKELLKWIKDYRPDLHKVLSTPEGMRYLKWNMKQALIQT
jgi:hypothetical protein